jgi:hypothetical protein
MGDAIRVKLPIPHCPFRITGSFVFDLIRVYLRSSAVAFCF